MQQIISYKNIFGSYQYNKIDNMYYGQLIYVGITAPFCGRTEEEMLENFKKAVDGYLCFSVRNQEKIKKTEKFS